jgi:hypothetical protein
MFVKIFGLLLFSGIGVWMLRGEWIDFKHGCARSGPIPLRARHTYHKDDPVGFWIVLTINTAFGIAFLVAGLLALLFAKPAS